MKVANSYGFLFSLAAVLLVSSAVPDALTAAQLQSPGVDADVIVIMRDQLPNVAAVRGARGARASAIAAAQAPILTELKRAGASKVHSFELINAVATTVSKAEAAHLAAHPLVQAVVPDRVLHMQPHSPSAIGGGGHSASSAAINVAGLCNTLEPEALQLTNAAFPNPATPQAQQVVDGNGQLVTGTGVKVAFIADGLDPTVPGFIRADGTPVFIDYRDFSGDPAGTPTPGGEAFGDASSIAAQDVSNHKVLTYDISKFVNPAHPLPSPCNIRIRGIAPGASLVGLKVFSNLGYTTTSSFVQAIDYAVVHDDVDVLNESFGGNPYPDNDNDPISLADDAAVRAGVTVVVSTGDAGTAGTLGSPSTNADVIAAGATTSYRLYAQTDFGAMPLGTGKYLSNNIASFSSGGYSQTGARTPSVVAPGDLGWALCSTNPALYTDCLSFAHNPTPIEDFGGTSESSPLTAGAAALVIQAYRSTHGGINPSPALVKQIIMSTAADIGAPPLEQGAGLINALAAVNAALSVQDGNGRPTKAVGDSLLNTPAWASVSGEPGTAQQLSFTITNTGATTQHLAPTLQTLGAPFGGSTINVALHPAHDPTFARFDGALRSYQTRTFTVPAGAQHLDAAIAFKSAFPSTSAPFVYFALFDPSGREVTYSEPQGADSAYGHSDVVAPEAGTWTVFIFTRTPGKGIVGSYTGNVQFTWAVENYVSFGTLQPSSLTLAPGQSANLYAQFTMPTQSGDSAAAIRFGQTADLNGTSQAEIPVSLRTLIPLNSSGGTFTGTLTGGNGRPGAGPDQTFAFNVPSGVRDMSLVVSIPDSGYVLQGLLVDPQGMELSVNANFDPTTGASQFALQHFRYSPQPGRWRFVLLQDFFSSGNQTSLTFSGRIAFNTAQVSATGLPNSPKTKLKQGAAVTIPVSVTNTGAVTEVFFADARLDSLASIPLLVNPKACGATTLPGACAVAFLPTEVSSVQWTASSSVPINMDAFPFQGFFVGLTGTPDIYARRSSTPDTVVASLSEPEIPYGPWQVVPAERGPYGPGGAPTEPFSVSGLILAQPFDSTVTSDSGDLWQDVTLGTSTFTTGLALAPGQTGTINVTIKPTHQELGTIVSGFLYIDTFNPNVNTGDEVVRIPYSYTVSP